MSYSSFDALTTGDTTTNFDFTSDNIQPKFINNAVMLRVHEELLRQKTE